VNKKTLASRVPFKSSERSLVSASHTKRILSLVAIQACLLITLYIITSLFYIRPFIQRTIADIRESFAEADVSTISFSGNSLSSDIDPKIFTSYSKAADGHQTAFVIDSIGSINPRFWEKREVDGHMTFITGIGLMKDHVFIKTPARQFSLGYRWIPGLQLVSLQKTQVDYLLAWLISPVGQVVTWFAALLFAVAFITFWTLFHSFVLFYLLTLISQSIMKIPKVSRHNSIISLFSHEKGRYHVYLGIWGVLLILQAIFFVILCATVTTLVLV